MLSCEQKKHKLMRSDELSSGVVYMHGDILGQVDVLFSRLDAAIHAESESHSSISRISSVNYLFLYV